MAKIISKIFNKYLVKTMQTNKQETYPPSIFKTTQHPETMWTITLFQWAKKQQHPGKHEIPALRFI